MFGPFLDKLKQGGFSGLGNGNGGNAELAATAPQFHPQPAPQGFIGPMVNAGMKPAMNPNPAGMSKAPAFGFMKPKPQVSNAGPQRPKPNRMLRRTF